MNGRYCHNDPRQRTSGRLRLSSLIMIHLQSHCATSVIIKSMHSYADLFAPLIGRILVGGFFIWNGIEVALNFSSTAATLFSFGAPMPITMLIIAIGIQVLCGIAIVVGYKTSPAALLLALYVLLVAFFYTGFGNAASQALFLQDMAIVGGLLYISAYGAGSWASDWHYKR